MSTFQAPLRVRGPILNSDGSPDVDAGQVVVSQTATIDFNDTTKTLFYLPPNSQIHDFDVDVTTAFDAGTNNLLDLGVVGGTATQFADGLSLATAARVYGSSDASQLANYADVGSSRIGVLATYEQSGTAPTAGAARITVRYSVNTTLPA